MAVAQQAITANGNRGSIAPQAPQAQAPESRDGQILRKEKVLEPGPLSRPSLPHRLVLDEGSSTSPGALPQLPPPPPPPPPGRQVLI